MDRWKDRAMGAAPVLIMLAAIGVDYGWQPDGTTSPRGDNIEYIVQISPDQLQQLQSIGEITSSIDPAVQNRVSRIVVRVGTEKLPRNPGQAREIEPSPSSTNGRTVSSSPSFGDQQDVPIPEISLTGQQALASAERASPSGGANVGRENANASVMKPDPQGGGFAMPASSQPGAPQDALDQVRGRAAQNANPPNFNSNDPRTGNGPSTDPALERENSRWADVSGRNGVTAANTSTSGFTGGPSTDEVPPSARTGDWSKFVGPLRPSDPNSLTNPLSRNQPNPYGAAASSNPPGANFNGYGTSPTFGSIPAGANTPSNGFGATYSPATNQSTGGFADQRTPPPVTEANGYTQDRFANIYNRDKQLVDGEGYLLDSKDAKYQNANGQLSDRYNNLYDSQDNPGDKYGNRIDKFGRPLSAGGNLLAGTPSSSPPVDPRLASAVPFTGYPNAVDYNGSPNYSSTQSTALQLEAQRLLALQQQQQQAEREYQARLRSNPSAQLAGYEEDPRSPSDVGLANAARLTAEQERAAIAAATKMKSFAAQPLFNFVLLISLVGNAYLIFETNNLRRKFRNMLSTFRSAKATAQPVS